MKLSNNLAFAAAPVLALAGPTAQGGSMSGMPGMSGDNMPGSSMSGGSGAGFPGFACSPSCGTSIVQDNWNSGPSAMCKNTTAIDMLNTCISGSSCSDSDKQSTFQSIAQFCVNAGQKITAAPEATFSPVSGASLSQWSTWPGANGNGNGNGGGPGGFVGGMPPFGPGGFGGFGSQGAWVSGPWTNWWGSSSCPPSTWPGWTSGSWSTNAPWTTWSACQATTTATSVVIETITPNGGGSPTVSRYTSFGIAVAQASSTGDNHSSSSAAAKPGFTLAGCGLAAFVTILVLL